MTNNNDENSPQESKLDLWIKQTLQEGAQPAGSEIVHQPAPRQASPHQPAPHQNSKNQGSAQQSRPAQQSQPSNPKKRFGFGKNRSNNSNNKSRSLFKGTGGFKNAFGSKDPRGQNGPSGYKGQKPNTSRPSNPAYPSTHPPRDPSKASQITHPATKFTQTKYTGKLKVIALSGLNEVGRNCMALEYGNDIIVIDMGFQFPEADFLGVDYIIPDTAYLEERKKNIKGVIFTHGHLDHIGGVPYIMPKLDFPDMYGTQLTMGLVEKRLKEFGQMGKSKIRVINDDDILRLGPFTVSFFSVTHSIPDSVGIVVKTPAGNIVHTGDFKFDLTPAGGQKIADFAKISSLSQQDIGALFIDSTNAQKPGNTITETKIAESLDAIVKNTEGRIIIASFASQIGRLQQVVNIAKKYGREIVLSGRSLEENFEMASKLGYLRYPPGLVHPIHKVKKMADNKAIILTTGSQGEAVSALTRMSAEEHSVIKIKRGDTVILSSSPIPGNERAIYKVINNLTRLGARVIDNKIMDVHSSGHGQEEDLKLMMTLVAPKAIVPIHGEYYMRAANKNIAQSLGYTDEQSILIENGDVLEIENNEVRVSKEKVPANYIMIDGLGIGDIGSQVIMDRQTLAENGVLIVMIPVNEKTKMIKGEVDIISRGFIYMKESEELIKDMAKVAADSYRAIVQKSPNINQGEIKNQLRSSIDKFIHQKLERYPLIIPIIIDTP